jgi:predicted nucleotidyltransferase
MFMMVNRKSPLTILNYLIERNNEAHVRDISRRTKLSLGFVSRILSGLAKEDLIILHKKGRMKFYRVNPMNPIIKQYKILKTVSLIMPIIRKIKSNTRRIILFGSSARGENVPESDIDLFVLTSEPGLIRKQISKKIKISTIIMDSEDFDSLKNKDAPLYSRIIRGITIWENE